MKSSRNIEIKVNRPDPTPEQINKHKDFKSFAHQFYSLHTPSGFRWLLKTNIKKLVLIVILALLLLLWYLGEL